MDASLRRSFLRKTIFDLVIISIDDDHKQILEGVWLISGVLVGLACRGIRGSDLLVGPPRNQHSTGLMVREKLEITIPSNDRMTRLFEI